jgi:hypothetical protein
VIVIAAPQILNPTILPVSFSVEIEGFDTWAVVFDMQDTPERAEVVVQEVQFKTWHVPSLSQTQVKQLLGQAMQVPFSGLFP